MENLEGPKDGSPKFKKNQDVWGVGLGAKYIAQPYKIRGIIEQDGEVLYQVKGKRTLYKEDTLYASEEEAQIALVSVFKEDLINYFKDFIACSKRIGCFDDMKEFMFKDGQLLLDAPKAPVEIYNTDRSNRPVPKFQPGQTVYGHTMEINRSEFPKDFVIKTANVVWFMGFGNVPPHWVTIYTLKRYGNLEVPESLLFATEREAIFDALEAEKHGISNIMYSWGQRSHALGIEEDMRHAVQANMTPCLLELKNELD